MPTPQHLWHTDLSRIKHHLEEATQDEHVRLVREIIGKWEDPGNAGVSDSDIAEMDRLGRHD